MDEKQIIMEIGVLKGQMESVKETLDNYAEKFDSLNATMSSLALDVRSIKQSYADEAHFHDNKSQNKAEDKRYKAHNMVLVFSAIIGALTGSIVTALMVFLIKG
ncbi:MAG: hypothetical protein ACYDG3_13425 [Bacillati bacterium]